MTEDQVPELLKELRSNEAYTRNDAIKKIIKGKIYDENIVAALHNIIDTDTYMTVRNFARSALDVFSVEHSAVEEPEVINLNNSAHVPLHTSKSEEILITRKSMLKAAGYFIMMEIFLSTISTLILAMGANGGYMRFSIKTIIWIMPRVALPTALFSLGLALRDENQTSATRPYSIILIVLACILFIPLCLIMLMFTLISE